MSQKFRLENEDQLLDAGFRKKIIEEIEGPENRARKVEAFKRYQCYKDQTFRYVQKQLIKQFDQDTVTEMTYALANLAIVRKVIDKLARVYKYGVKREVPNKQPETEALEGLAKTLDFNSAVKKANRYFKLFKNTVLYICPVMEAIEGDAEQGKMGIKVVALPPYLYDAIELTTNREKPACFVLSDFNGAEGLEYSTNAARAGRTGMVATSARPNDGTDQTIADRPEDSGKEEKKTYIFWSDKYHFTCSENGDIVQGDADNQFENPIKEKPFVNFAEDQDNAFWAIGGEDLVDGAILLNSLITNLNHIGITQGYGQLVMTGNRLPKQIKVGPNKAVQLEYSKEEDPTPTFDFKTANPPLDELKGLIEMYAALLLTTNNLSTSGVSSSLSGSSSFPSGIAMMIDKSESMEDVEDQRQVFHDGEPRAWSIIAKWGQVLGESQALCEEQAEFFPVFNEEAAEEMTLKFTPPKPIESEKEKLEVIKTKRDMGLITMVEAIMEENPGLTKEEAEKKLLEIAAEQAKRMQAAMNTAIATSGQRPGASQPPVPGKQDPEEDEPNESNQEKAADEEEPEEGSEEASGGEEKT